jgi:hypothetical protein
MKKPSIMLQILTDLLNGIKHTAWSIAMKFKTTRGMARIYELIALGFPIKIRKILFNGHYHNEVSI